MVTITVNLPNEKFKNLREMAERFQIPPEELVRVSIEVLFNPPSDDFQQALERVLAKNVSLYKRLE